MRHQRAGEGAAISADGTPGLAADLSFRTPRSSDPESILRSDGYGFPVRACRHGPE
jgi:hypothetical protein